MTCHHGGLNVLGACGPLSGSRGTPRSATSLPFGLASVRTIPLSATAVANFCSALRLFPRTSARPRPPHAALRIHSWRCSSACAERQLVEGGAMERDDTVRVGEYAVPVDPMEDLQCDSCQ
jgi:hypothetical protein